jgi:hypothetical protein
MTDWGTGCTETSDDCTLHNLHCGYPNCPKGKRDKAKIKTPTELIVERMRSLGLAINDAQRIANEVVHVLGQNGYLK